MKEVTLIFPTVDALTDYILAYQVNQAEVDSREQTLTAPLTAQDILNAHKDYRAELKKLTKLD